MNGEFQHSVDGDVETAEPQTRNRLLHLSDQLDLVQSQLARLDEEWQAGSSQLDALARMLTDTRLMQPVIEQLAELTTQVSGYQDQLDALKRTFDATARQSQLEALAAKLDDLSQREQVEELSLALKKMGRTQFKANALGESKEAQVGSALDTLQEIIDRRDQLQAQRRLLDQERLDDERSQARGALVADFLPALDGLELALENGRSLLAQQRQTLQRQQAMLEAQQGALADRPPPPGMWEKFRRSFSAPPTPAPAAAPPSELPDATPPLLDAFANNMAAWLEGLDLVRERMLALLGGEGIREIPALGQPFDPHLHVALETTAETDAVENSVVRVVRKGYQQQRRVLRYTEVVVARRPKAPQAAAEGEDFLVSKAETQAVTGEDAHAPVTLEGPVAPFTNSAQEPTGQIARLEPSSAPGDFSAPDSEADTPPEEETYRHDMQKDPLVAEPAQGNSLDDNESPIGRDTQYG